MYRACVQWCWYTEVIHRSWYIEVTFAIKVEVSQMLDGIVRWVCDVILNNTNSNECQMMQVWSIEMVSTRGEYG